MIPSACPFCDYDRRTLVWQSDLAVAFRDAFPVSPGHTLVIPRRHVATYFDASPWEQQALWQGVDAVKRQLDACLPKPDGYNVGFNAGEAAGQTVMHLHVHVIPRYSGDTDDPRGGVRGVIPGKQRYGAAEPATRQQTADSGPFEALARFIPGEEQQLLPVMTRAFRVADEIDIVSAFVQLSGVSKIEDDLVDALDRGAQVRLLTGDYMGVTHPHALQRLFTLSTLYDRLHTRLYRVPAGRSFHPKAYLFAKSPHGVAFVGSSNLSHTALTDGVEWNLKTTRADGRAFQTIRARFERLFNAPESIALSAKVVEDYQRRVPVRPTPRPEPAADRPTPHGVQVEVLQKLLATRAEGDRRGLVVMATGLGKTYLSAFDLAQHGGKRALFVAHREEILAQAAATWAKVLPSRTTGFLAGGRKDGDVDLLFASVQTLSRVRHLREFAADHFDYIVIDEFHHAAANSYRKLLGHFEPDFLLGLTATPDRMDGAALLELCDDNLVARVSLIEGITRKLLVPFRYFGVKDTIDFAPIPWRGRFDEAALTEAAATSERANQALEAYLEHARDEGRRTLAFCCSVRHADFMAEYLRAHGVAAAAVHSGPTSDSRAGSLEGLRDGTLECICAVDIFNEGVDLPDVNTILMLRPTESPIIFMQQLGRGLRQGTTTDKRELVVVDFIGNHRSFLVKPQALVALTGMDAPPGAALRMIRDDQVELPDGCSIHIETAALAMLETVAKLSKDDHLLYVYDELRSSHGRRPTASEVFDAGAHLGPIKKTYGTWFDFVLAQDDLEEGEKAALDEHRAWFSDLSKTRMPHSYKMVALQALDDADALHDAINIDELARRCRALLDRDLVLRHELREHEAGGAGDDDDFARRWRQTPLRIFHDAKGFARQWFAIDGDRFVSRLAVDPEMRDVFDAMTAELVAFRLLEHRTKHRFVDNVLPFNAPIPLRVSHSSGKPVLRFDRKRRPDIPEGDTTVEVDGQRYLFRFAKSAVNVAMERAGGPNVLPVLMRRWLGPTAGQPGTRHTVELVARPDGSWLLRQSAPIEGDGVVIPLGTLPYFSDLKVACGVAGAQFEGHDVKRTLSVASKRKLDARRHFIVRAHGDSMDGGSEPIRDGDLVLCELATVTDPTTVEGRPVLLTGGTGDEAFAYLKIPIRREGGWLLRSTNPTEPDRAIDPTLTLRVVARVLEVVEERQGPTLWSRYDRDAIAALFGYDNDPSWRSGHRDVEVDGEPHSILMVNLRKPVGTPLEHRYADRFISASELQWESQASTSPAGAKGRRILGHASEGRHIHLFVRYHTKDADGRGEPFVYCGTLQTVRHEGSKPIRVWFDLDTPLPPRLWRVWSAG